MFSAIDFLKFLTIPLLGLVFVNGGVVSYEGCPPFCKEKSLHPLKKILCADDCGPTHEDVSTSSCFKACLAKNPEGAKLCQMNCKNSKKATTDLPVEILHETGRDLPSIMSQTYAHMKGIMNHLWDKATNAKDWISHGYSSVFNSNTVAPIANDNKAKEDDKMKEEDKVNEDEKVGGKDDKRPVEGNVEIRVWRLGGGNVADKAEEEEKKTAEKEKLPEEAMSPIDQPVLHRFIIIRRLPIFSIFKQQAKDNTGGQGMEAHGYYLGRSEMGKCAWRRPVLFVLLALLCICSTWYCMARLLAYRNRWIQESVARSSGEDFEYLIPIDEKMLFLKSDTKLSLIDEATPPPPYKPAPPASATEA